MFTLLCAMVRYARELENQEKEEKEDLDETENIKCLQCAYFPSFDHAMGDPIEVFFPLCL